jgi:tetratricopeptide (TPR) repeat protein
LEVQIAMSPRKSMTSENRLQRCRQLAMLGQTDVALAELTPLFEAEVAAPAFDLAGTIHESISRWEVAKTYHQRAIAGWQSQPASRQRDVGLVGSVMRLAYCERKLGHYDVAESHYLEVLAHAPTAENHFLLAQFYEDMQQSSKAHAHARRAMALDPRRYQREGKKLIDKLILGHFGCLQVFREESKANSATRSVDFSQDLTRPLSK